MTIHAANADKSKRLLRVLGLLSRGGWWGTRAIIRATDCCAISSIAAELRANGHRIETRCVGRGRWQYRLRGRA